MIKYYSFAGVDLCVMTEDGGRFEDKRLLSTFAAAEQENCHRFMLRCVQQLDPPLGTCVHEDHSTMIFRHQGGTVNYVGNISNGWENADLRVDHRNLEHEVQINTRMYRNGISEKAVLNALSVENLIAQAGGFILHASFVVWNGKAILFTAPSETGKSTQAELWRQYRGAQIVNGDRAVVRMTDRGPSAWGLPFAGSSPYCANQTAPLAAVVYLSQANETSIQKVTGYQAFRRIWEGVNVNRWDSENVMSISQMVAELIQQVPVYHLACTPDETAVKALEHMLIK